MAMLDVGKRSSGRVAARSFVGVLIAALAAVWPASARADEPEWENQPAARRSGFTVGLLAAGGFGMASGYPLDLKKIGRERYYTQTSVAVQGTGLVWIGAALTDWMTVGLGTSGNLLGVSDYTGGGGAALLHVEAFPLWPLGGFFRELGAMLDGGASLAVFSPADDEAATAINGGASSYIGGGVFYEGLRFWHMSTGPSVYANYMWSDTVRYGNIGVGWRLVLYTGGAAKASPGGGSKKASAWLAPR